MKPPKYVYVTFTGEQHVVTNIKCVFFQQGSIYFGFTNALVLE